jgi:signal transduction histidine kinase
VVAPVLIYLPGVYFADLPPESAWKAVAAGVVLLVSAAFQLVVARAAEAPRANRPSRGRTLFATATLVAGTLWGVLCAYAVTTRGLDTATLILLAGACGLCVASSSLAPCLRVHRAYLGVVALPAAAATLHRGGADGFAAAAVLLLLSGLLTAQGGRAHREYWTALVNRRLLEERAEELEAAQARLDEARRAAPEFLTNMSHETRTPINGITGMAGLLDETDLSREQREYVDSIRRSADALLELITTILEISRVEAGQVSLEDHRFDLARTISGIAETMADAAREKGVDLVVEYPPGVPRLFRGDEGRVRQILTNLAGNALKFTQEGRVRIAVECAREERGTAMVVVAVEDSGVGIPAEKLATVFDKFTQADGSATRRFGGTGLGLAMTRQLTELIGGEIGVESVPGKGSIFRVRLPLALEPAPDANGPRPSTRPAALSARKETSQKLWLSPRSASRPSSGAPMNS